MPDPIGDEVEARCQRLATVIRRHAARNGFIDTPIDGLQLVASDCHRPREPVCYQPGLVFVVQGDKTGYLDGRLIHYGTGHYLVQAMPLPFECETRADAARPLLGAALRIEPDVLAELTTDLPAAPDRASTPAFARDETLPMAAVALDAPIGEALERLLACLDDPDAARVLAEARIREVIFEALRGPQGHLLRQLMSEQSSYARIGHAIARLQADFAMPLSVAELAGVAHMSVSSFHAHFKRVTHLSPLQYQKRMRLLRARELLLARHTSVAGIAASVGYQSASQFSREYKRYFGVAPVNDIEAVGAAV